MAQSPSMSLAASIAQRSLGLTVTWARRFTTGAANHVYDLALADGTRCVVRLMSRAEDCDAAVRWSNQLRPLGIPLPRLLAYGHDEYPWLLLERLPGTALGDVYGSLDPGQKRAIAAAVVGAQRIVHRTPPGNGFGFARRPDDCPHRSWQDVVTAELERARSRIRSVGVVDEGCIARVEKVMGRFRSHFESIGPTAFLDDTTTKNVLVDRGTFQGIVDVDCLCYGDPLYTPGLTRMALLGRGFSLDYIDYWLDEIGGNDADRQVVGFYSAVFCINFLSELGQQFNRDSAPAVDAAEVARLESLLRNIIVELE